MILVVDDKWEYQRSIRATHEVTVPQVVKLELGQSGEEQAASAAEREALAKEAEAAGEAMAGNIEELLAPGMLVVTKGLPLIKDYVTLFYDLITYGKEKELDTSGAEDFEFEL